MNPEPRLFTLRQKRLPVRKRAAMTIALGFNCPDGIVLCTDSLETDGQTKSMVEKIWCYETQGEWGIAVASAGEADFAESFTDNLNQLFAGEHFDKDKIMARLRAAINAARITYPDLGWEALIALFGPGPMDRNLLRVGYKSKHLAPVPRFGAFGMGAHLAKFLCSQMYTLFMDVDEAAELGIFVVKRCKEHVEGCEGPTSVLTWKIGQDGWAPYTRDGITKIESKFDRAMLRDNLLDFWIAQTPHLARQDPIYRNLPEGGFVKFRRAMGLRGTPDNPSRLISKTKKSRKRRREA